MHILTLTPFYPSTANQVRGCFVTEPLRALEKIGVRSSVIAVSPIYHPRVQPLPSSPALWVRYPQIPGNIGLSNAGRWLYARLLPKVSRLHKENPIDVIHAHAALPCGHAAALLSQRLRIPFVVTLHGLDVFNTCFLSGAPAKWRRKASMNVYRAARSVICISDKVSRLLLDGMQGRVQTEIVYNGTDTDLFSPDITEASSPKGPEILVVGNLAVGKGHELVFRAIDRLKVLFPVLSCRVIGEGADRVRFEALVRELGIADRVRFEGTRSRKEVAQAMQACSVFVLPSRNEGLGCVYLEAMACGKPVIACRGQGIDAIIKHGENGWLIPSWSAPDDAVEELVQGLSSLLSSADLRSNIGAAARETILGQFTLSHQAQGLARIYRKAIA